MGDIAGDGDAVQSVPTAFDWGLDYIDQRTSVRDFRFVYQNTGAGVHAYVMDGGIWIQHPDFGGRASLDYCPIPGRTADDIDWNSPVGPHGTPAASIIGGTRAGVAKNVRLHSVKISENNRAYVSDVTRGFDWIVRNHVKPAVVNCSFGFKRIGSSWFWQGTSPFEKAARRVLSAGVTVVVSAGNENQNADGRSPAWRSELITVGASDVNNNRAVYNSSSASNYGSVIDLFAPGKEVTASSYYGQGSGRIAHPNAFFGGTSAAAPYVTGVVALYLQSNPNASPAQVQDWLKNNATQNRINTNNLPSDTTRRFLFTNQ